MNDEQYNEVETFFREVYMPVASISSGSMNNIHNQGVAIYHRPFEKKQIDTIAFPLFLLHSSNVVKAEGFQSLLEGVKKVRQGEIASWNFFNKSETRNETVFISNPMPCSNLGVLKERIGKPIFNIAKLRGEYFFKEAYLSYQPILKKINPMEYRNRTENKEEPFKIMGFSNVIESYRLVYDNGFNAIILHVNERNVNSQISLSMSEEEMHLYDRIEIVKVNGQVAMYRVYAKGNKHLISENGRIVQKDIGGCQELVWINNKNALMKLGTGVGNKMDKNKMILIAECVKI